MAWCDNTVRHEALQVRVEVRGLHLPVVAATGGSGGQPDLRGAGEGGSGPDEVRTARDCQTGWAW
jgi:hypothetical protein